MTINHFYFALGCVLISPLCSGQTNREAPPEPTLADVAYGDHPQQVLDFYQAEVEGPAPLVIYIHGGGFTGGSKDRVSGATIRTLRDAGIHFASVEYRFLKDAKLPAAHRDAVRALQFIRYNSDAWGIDPKRVGAYGGSAGAQLVAYLAWHDDQADPDSEDPVARESTRLACVAPLNGQSTMDLNWWQENIPGYDQRHREINEYIDQKGSELERIVREISIINLISADDPPVYMRYAMRPDDPIPEKNASGWKIHHVNFGVAMEEKLRNAGVEVTLAYPGPETRFKSEVDFFIHHLLPPQP